MGRQVYCDDCQSCTRTILKFSPGGAAPSPAVTSTPSILTPAFPIQDIRRQSFTATRARGWRRRLVRRARSGHRTPIPSPYGVQVPCSGRSRATDLLNSTERPSSFKQALRVTASATRLLALPMDRRSCLRRPTTPGRALRGKLDRHHREPRVRRRAGPGASSPQRPDTSRSPPPTHKELHRPRDSQQPIGHLAAARSNE